MFTDALPFFFRDYYHIIEKVSLFVISFFLIAFASYFTFFWICMDQRHFLFIVHDKNWHTYLFFAICFYAICDKMVFVYFADIIFVLNLVIVLVFNYNFRTYFPFWPNSDDFIDILDFILIRLCFWIVTDLFWHFIVYFCTFVQTLRLFLEFDLIISFFYGDDFYRYDINSWNFRRIRCFVNFRRFRF